VNNRNRTQLPAKTYKKASHRVTRENNVITIHAMNHPACVTSFHRALNKGLEDGIDEFIIVWKGDLVYPDACVPIAGIISFYNENYNIKFKFEIPENSYLARCGFITPYVKTDKEIESEPFPFDKVFRYSNSAQVASLTQVYVDNISRQTECNDGVLTGLIWCINEILDNVLVHSDAGQGFVMAQYHQAKKTIAICIYDSGIGIYKSLKKSIHKPQKDTDAISLAIQEGVGDGKGQGNGMYGLYQIVNENKGSLSITSGTASIMWTEKLGMRKFEHLPLLSDDYRGTSVDFRLNLANEINIQSAFKSIGGFDGFDIRLDDMLQDDNRAIYDVFENSMGTATREAGFYLRNDVINTMTRLKSGITLDFKGVKTVSSSFVDEFIAKLFLRLGFINFNHMIKIINMNENVKFLCERSLYMRIHDEWKSNK